MKCNIIDAYQGTDGDNHPYGYVGIDDEGGYFFTWLDTLEATLDSLEADEIDRPKHDFASAARQALTEAIGADFGRLHDAAYGAYPAIQCKF